MTYKIAIANEKGGVAKTTTAVSLAGAISESQKRVLLIDLDPQANLTLALGIKPNQVSRSISRVILNSDEPSSVVYETAIEGIDLIPSNSEMGLAERFLPIRQNYHTVLRNALFGLVNYDYIILDCPPALGAITTNAMTAADLLVIPSQAEYFSAYALKKMMAAVRQVRKNGNPSLIYRVLVTMLDRRNRTHRALLAQLYATFGIGLFQSIIEIDTKLRESPIVGLPITTYFSQSRSANQYRELAQEISQNVEKIKQQAIKQSA
ncbi:MAG: ParA family protein [Chloroflexi bacterium]|nr:ParA family protein [Chloroflexota bacterium]